MYDTTQDSVALKTSAEVAIEAERYVIQHPATVIANNDDVAPSGLQIEGQIIELIDLINETVKFFRRFRNTF